RTRRELLACAEFQKLLDLPVRDAPGIEARERVCLRIEEPATAAHPSDRLADRLQYAGNDHSRASGIGQKAGDGMFNGGAVLRHLARGDVPCHHQRRAPASIAEWR